jgi:hypothetical protein
MKGLPELSPRHLVAVMKSGGEVNAPNTGGHTKLLVVYSLLKLRIVQELKLELGDAKPVI